MAGLSIDWMLLEAAFESHAPEQRTFLDANTGNIQVFADGIDAGGQDTKLGPGTWIRVEPIPSREQYRMMERFIATVTNTGLKDALQDSIVGKGAFRRFKDAVGRYPEERKRWFAFRDALLHRFILDWLKQHKLELQEIPAWNLDPPMTPSPEPAPSAITEHAAVDAAGVPQRVEATAPLSADRAELEALRGYLQSWARSHGEEYHYLFGPAAFERLANDMTQEFIIYRKRSL
ncbi:MAG: UPF0158 family protein [Deltaproteobacteria bacterium]|nr:UPF0158 family protein [Deltaproteobacteria bacterium]